MLKTWLRGASLIGIALASSSGAFGADALTTPGQLLENAQEGGRVLFKLADENNDGQISQKEAIDAGNLLVGGFFFRADANGDGMLSKDEADTARDNFLAMHPVLRVVFEKNRNVPTSTGTNPVATVKTLIDTNQDGNLQATEVRQFVQTGVTAFFASADTDRNGNLSPSEVNAAIVGVANAMAQAAFETADTDHNGQISAAEFDKAIQEPARAVFRAVDVNNDGQISQQEAQAARQTVMSQMRALRTPEPANSPRNLIRSGTAPSEAAPIPRIDLPRSNNQPAAPHPLRRPHSRVRIRLVSK